MSKNWKTRWCSLLLVLSMLAGLCVPAYAVPEDGSNAEAGSSASEAAEVDAGTGIEKNSAAIAETEDVVWSNNFDTTVSDDTGKWENNLAPENFNTFGFNEFKGTVVLKLDDQVKNSGAYSLYCSSTDGNTKISLTHSEEIDYTKNYILRARVKANGADRGNGWAGPVLRAQVMNKTSDAPDGEHLILGDRQIGTWDWKDIEVPIEDLVRRSGGNTSGKLQIEWYYENFKGEIWIDDLQLICTGTPEPPDPPDPGETDPDQPEEPDGPPAVLEGYPAPTAEWTDSFEETQTVTGTAASYWKNATAPKGWDQMWVAIAPSSPEKMYFEVANDEKAHGHSSVHIHSEDAGGRIAVFPLVSGGLDYSKDYILRIRVKSENVTGTGFYFRIQVGTKYNKNVFSESRKVTGTSDWTVYEIKMEDIAAKAEDNSGNFKLELYAEKMTGDVWVDAIEFVPDYRIKLDKTSVKLESGNKLQLNATLVGTNENLSITWTSSDESVATVDQNGLVTAVNGGLAEIKASTDEYHSAVCTVQVPDPAVEATFASMREKWVDRLTGNPYWNGDATIASYKAVLAGWDEAAANVRSKLVKEDPTKLFSDLNLDIQSDLKNKANSTLSSDSEPYFTAMSRIQDMAKVWAAEGSQYYHNEALKDDILDALTWMEEHVYNAQLNNQAMFGNWYHWWISLPQSLAGTVILMHDEMDADLLAKEAAVLARFNEDPIYVYKVKGAAGRMEMTGANLADTSLASLLRGAAGSDQVAAANGTKYFDQIVQVVTNGDGLYADGSFIQHSNLAYTGGYGSTLLNNAEKLLYMSTGTLWAVDSSDVAVVYDFIWNGVRPLYAGGAMFDMVNGRGVARPSSADVKTGRGILLPIVLLTDSAPTEYQGKLKSFAKAQLIAGANAMGEEEYFNHSNVAAVIAAQALAADSSVTADSNAGYAKVFGSMDKAVAHTERFSLGVSYASSRTGRFEFGNEENKQGWHQSDGAVYLYYGDPKQYADNYWNTVDSHRLAGITTDGSEWEIKNWGNYVGNGAFNGGSVSGPYLSLAQDFKNYSTAGNPNLAAKKSWFVFDGEVVALGAGITGVNGTAETIVDNKKINGDNTFVVDGAAAVSSLGDNASSEGAQWAWLAGNTSADSIGYFFPETADLNLLREARTSSWSAINGASGVSTEPVTRNYLSIAIPHEGAEGDSYSYVLLPGMSQTETQAYASSSGVTILSNTAQLQAVADKSANAAGFTFWEAGTLQMPEGSAIASISSDSAASVTLYQKDGKIYVGVSDPSQRASAIQLTLTGESLDLGALDTGVAGTKTETGVELIVTVSGLHGETLTAQLSGGSESPDDQPSGGSSSGGSSSSTVTVPVSGDKNSVDVKASVSGSTATVEKIDTAHLDEVAGSDVDTGMVEIDFTGLSKPIDTVKLPTDAVREIAKAASDSTNDTEGLAIKLSTGEAAFDAAALDAVQEQASGAQITLSIAPAKASDLNARQKEVVGSSPVFDLTMKSGSKAITSFGSGYVTISLPHTLEDGQDPAGVVVYYLDDEGNIHRCQTMYDVQSKTVIFTTNHMSLYVVGYEENPFADVSADDYFFEAVLWAVKNGITSGTSATTFGPHDSCTRGQMVTLLWRAAGSPAPQSGNSPFMDLQPGAYYYDAVCWAVENGITSGTSATTFSPDAIVTRGQAVTFLHAYAGSPAAVNGTSFADVASSAYYASSVAWAAEKGITSGTGPDTFSPDAVCTRGQIVTFFYRSMK